MVKAKKRTKQNPTPPPAEWPRQLRELLCDDRPANIDWPTVYDDARDRLTRIHTAIATARRRRRKSVGDDARLLDGSARLFDVYAELVEGVIATRMDNGNIPPPRDRRELGAFLRACALRLDAARAIAQGAWTISFDGEPAAVSALSGLAERILAGEPLDSSQRELLASVDIKRGAPVNHQFGVDEVRQSWAFARRIGDDIPLEPTAAELSDTAGVQNRLSELLAWCGEHSASLDLLDEGCANALDELAKSAIAKFELDLDCGDLTASQKAQIGSVYLKESKRLGPAKIRDHFNAKIPQELYKFADGSRGCGAVKTAINRGRKLIAENKS